MHLQLKMNLQQPQLNGFRRVSYETEKRKNKQTSKQNQHHALNIDNIFVRGKPHKTKKYIENQWWRGPDSGVGLGQWKSDEERAGRCKNPPAWPGEGEGLDDSS